MRVDGDCFLLIYIDGAYSSVTDCGGWGVVVKVYTRSGVKEYKFSGSETQCTNNKMEVCALSKALKFVEKFRERFEPDELQVLIVSDSAYVINTINQGWLVKWYMDGWCKADGKVIANNALWSSIYDSLKRQKKNGTILFFGHTSGHSGVMMNEKADRLAVAARLKLADALELK